MIWDGPAPTSKGWQECYLRLKTLHADVDAIYVQNYGGAKYRLQEFAYVLYGTTLDPTVFCRIIPGLASSGVTDGMSPANVQSTLATYDYPHETPVGSHLTIPPLLFGGAFIWSHHDILSWYKNDPQQALKDYCAAIINGLKLPN